MELINQIQGHVTLLTLYYAFAILVGFDVLTGIIKAWKQGRIKSRTMRNGLFVSFGEILLLTICIVATTLIPIVNVAVYTIMIYMCLKELSSVLENLLEIGVILPAWLTKGLQVYTDKLDKGEN